MSSLVARDLHQVCIEGCVVASCSELRLCKIGKTFTVELVLKMLEGKSIVENIS